MSLGTYPAVSIKAARAKASLYAEATERGENPIDTLEENAVDRRDTVAALIDDYLTHAEQTMRSARNAKWISTGTCGLAGKKCRLERSRSGMRAS